jgi:tetratricopeptide (TPR) repeat protein
VACRNQTIMRKIARTLVASLALLFAASNGFGAGAIEFYQNLLRRGMADFNAGRFDAAERELRISVFGLVDLIDQYQTAHIYLALSAERLGHTEEAQRAVDRVQVAEQIQPRYATLPLPPDVRAAFEALMQRLAPAATAPMRVPPKATAPAPRPQASATVMPPAVKPPAAKQPAVKQPTLKQPAVQQPVLKEPIIVEREIPFEAPAVKPPAPIVVPKPPQRRELVAADRALAADDLATARAIYRENLETTSDRATLLRIAEGLYRARDFAGALAAFQRTGELRSGEQPYRYYRAVAYYETGDYVRAQAELQAALPYIEITDDVARYRAKIMAAIN